MAARSPLEPGASLPGERVPFPVAREFRIRPDMRRWPDDDRGHLRVDARLPAYLEAKLELLGSDPAGCRVPAPGVEREALVSALLRVAEGLAEDAGSARGAQPGVVVPIEVDAERLRFPLLGLALTRSDLELTDLPGPELLAPSLRRRAEEHLAGLRPLERLADALALAVQEDLVVMAAAGAPDGSAELLHVCFPSSWDPAARAGAGFASLHAPVPHGEVLSRAAPQVLRAMVTKGPFVRYVWSLAPDGALDRNPRRRPHGRTAAAPSSPEGLWFRVERQTVMPLPALERALLTIRVYTAPLGSVLTSRERRSRLAAAVASMDEALLTYKGIGDARDELLAWLEPSAPG